MALRVWLPLDGTLENKGISNIIPTLMGSGITYTAGKIGNAATFPNACNSCIHMPGLKLQILTWTCWFKCAGEGSASSQRMLSEGRDTGSVGTNIWLSKAGTTLYWSAHKVSGSVAVTLNTWYHVALTCDGSKVHLYLNGIEQGTGTAYTSDSDYAQSSDRFVLGKMAYSYTSTGNYFPFNGQLNDVRVYDHCLSAAEVKEISQGLVLHYKLDDITHGIQDSSGYGHNGTITGTITLNGSTPRYSSCSLFNGTERIVAPAFGQDIIRTLSCWCKTTKNKSTSQHMVADSASGMGISFYNGTIIGVFGTVRSTGSKCTLGDSYKENAWNHIVVVRTSDDGKRDIYCNGVKLTPASDDYWSAATGFWVGARNTSQGNAFYGNISDVRAYCTALSADDILTLYHTVAKVDNLGNWHTFEFAENSSIAKVKKTGITQANEVHDNLLFRNKAQIIKNNAQILIQGDLNIVTTKSGHTKTGGIASLPAATVQSLAGKTVRLVYDVCAPGARNSTEQGQTAYNYTRYGIHGSCTMDGSTSYPFAGELNYSGNSKHTIQTWTIPTGKTSYGALGFSIQNFDKPSSTNNETWFIRNVRLELVEGTLEDITGTNLIEF